MVSPNALSSSEPWDRCNRYPVGELDLATVCSRTSVSRFGCFTDVACRDIVVDLIGQLIDSTGLHALLRMRECLAKPTCYASSTAAPRRPSGCRLGRCPDHLHHLHADAFSPSLSRSPPRSTAPRSIGRTAAAECPRREAGHLAGVTFTASPNKMTWTGSPRRSAGCASSRAPSGVVRSFMCCERCSRRVVLKTACEAARGSRGGVVSVCDREAHAVEPLAW